MDWFQSKIKSWFILIYAAAYSVLEFSDKFLKSQ
jgi:hypothetical protein